MESDNSSNSYRRGLSMHNFVGIPQGLTLNIGRPKGANLMALLCTYSMPIKAEAPAPIRLPTVLFCKSAFSFDLASGSSLLAIFSANS